MRFKMEQLERLDCLDETEVAPNGWTEENTNPNILYIAVEYIKNEFKLQSDGGQFEFDPGHVSPLDPNMSSVAPYSPIYATDSTSNVYDQDVCPEVVIPETEPNVSTEIVPAVDQYLHINEKPESLVPGVAEQEVDILITDQTTGISYLVETCLADDSQLLDTETLLDADLLSLDESVLKAQLSEMITEETPINCEPEILTEEKRRSSRLSGIKRENEDELLSCVQQISDRPILSRARATLPESYLIILRNKNGDESVFAKKFIPKRTQFGPIEGILTEVKKENNEIVLSVEEPENNFQFLDVSNEEISNWMCFVRLARVYSEQNLVLTQQDNSLYYTTIKNIYPRQELLVNYGVQYATKRSLPLLEPVPSEEDLWPCYECTEKFTSSELLQKHLDKHEEDEPLNQNGFIRKVKTGLVKKVNTVFNKNTPLQCTICLDVIEYEKFDELRAHLNGHGLDKNEPLQDRFIIAKKYDEAKKDEEVKLGYKCTICYKYFATGERMQRHMLVHGSDETKPIKCDKCDKRFLTNSALAIHFKTHLLGRKVFECPICKDSFQQVLQLKLHVPKHCVDGQYRCPHCPKHFDKYSIIRKHIRAFHCEHKHLCPDCGKTFPTLDKLRMHLLRHSDHKEFLCADCGKQFKRKDKLKEHCKRMHSDERENAMPIGEQESTPSSGKKFTPKIHPMDYMAFIYKCHTCQLGFKRRGMLVNHLAKRHPDISPNSVPELNLPILRTTKDYYCNYCDKVYKSSSKRKAHILKNHPGAALPVSNRKMEPGVLPDEPNPTFSKTVGSVTTSPHSCTWCHKQYASKAKLLQHQRKKHADAMKDAPAEERNEDEEDVVMDVVQQDGHYYQVVALDGAELSADSKLYKLLTTGKNSVPPR